MIFRLQRLRFTFVARDPIRFGQGQAGNTLRGALGLNAQRLYCSEECPGARICPNARSCTYARIFEPTLGEGHVSNVASPSGLADLPRPYVVQAENLSGCTFEADERFSFFFHLFLLDAGAHDGVRNAFRALESSGLGARRSRVLFEGMDCEEINIDLLPRAEAVTRLVVKYVTPTELKGGTVPDFGLVARRVRDRVSTLSQFYGAGAVRLDFEAYGRRADQVATTRCATRIVERQRRSSRTGQIHSLGGFVGEAEYAGDLTEFIPYFEAARYTGVGRQASWGKGEIALEY